MKITFTDPGYQPKIVEIDSAEEFFEAVRREGGDYTDADSGRRSRKYAWRPLGGEWVEGSFGDSLRAACQKKGFELGKGYNMRRLRDLLDYEGMSLEEVAELLKKEQSS